ncbi:MAG: chromosome segregation protein ScpA [Methanomassiliicoccaceae archaeon]|nr:chromosome segregation protein ScpA [Methanomassiliicoccaceae archaeon]
MERDGKEKGKMEEMEQHLLFHKALIDDNVGTGKIDKYIGLLRDGGPTETMNDPVDESIRSAFSLVLEHDQDPWAIDIVEFAHVYSTKKVKSAVDLIVAGKLIHMAWKILKMQSAVTLEEGEREEIENDGFDMGFDFDAMYEPDKLYVPDVEFREAIRRSTVRPITMIELLDAFEEARDEMETYMAREQARLELLAKQPKFNNKAHLEDDSKEYGRILDNIENLGTGPIPIRDLYVNSIKANITTIVGVLFWVKEGKLTIWQDNMPYGEIYVEKITEWIEGKIEDSEAQELVKRAVV